MPTPTVFDYSFAEGPGEWTTWLAPSLITGDPGLYDSYVRHQAPGDLDPNHVDGIGPIWLVSHLATPQVGGPGILNLVNATIELTIKTTDFVANGAKLYFWLATGVQSGNITENFFVGLQGTNWANTGNDLTAQLSSEWTTITVTLDTNPANWTYAGNNVSDQGDWAKRYVEQDIATSLSFVDQTLHLVLLGESPDQKPTGFLDIANIRITTTEPAIQTGATITDDAFQFWNAIEDTPLTGVLAGDPAVVPNPTSFTLVPGSSVNGDVTINPLTGEFTFTPAPNYFGATDFFDSARFFYQVSNGTVTSAPIRVEITTAPINDAPLTFAASEDLVGLGPQTIRHSLRKGTDPDDSTTLTFAVVDGSVVGGTLTLDRVTGQYVFEPTPGFTGIASFDYTVSDGQLTSAPKLVQLEINASATPLPDFVTLSNTTIAVGDRDGFVRGVILLAEAGDENAAYHYGTWLAAGLNVTQDAAKAAEMLQLAVGTVEDASLQLAGLYTQGNGVAKDFGVARDLLEALPNNINAQYRLGLLSELGFGGPVDLVAAAEYFEAAAERGHADAMYTLGRRYLAGQGVPTDPALAYFWLGLGLRFNAGTGLIQHTDLIQRNANQAKAQLTEAQITAIDIQIATFIPINTPLSNVGITLTGSGVLIGGALNDRLTGEALSDTLLGFGGDDILTGGPGAPNTMQGGTGDDLYIVQSSGDSTFELAGEGTDTVWTALASHILRVHVENLKYIGSGNFIGIGNAGDNVLTGGIGSDSFDGGDGTDTVVFLSTIASNGIAVQAGTQLTVTTPGEGTDVLINVERITLDGAQGGTITVVVDAGNAVVTSVNDTKAVSENGVTTVGAAAGVLANDINLDASASDIAVVTAIAFGSTAGTVGTPIAGAHGTLTIMADGGYSYTPIASANALGQGQSLTDVFTYMVDDGDSGTSLPATLTIVVTGENDAPQLGADASVTLVEDQNVTPQGLLTASGTLTIADVDTGQSSFRARTETGDFGTFTIAADGSWTYAADNNNPALQALGAGVTRVETFTARSFDGSAANTVTITIVGASDGLSLASTALGSYADTPAADTFGALSGSLLGAVTDADPVDTYNFVLESSGVTPLGTLTLAGNGDYSFAPNAAAINALLSGSQTLSFSVLVTDGQSNQARADFTITVTAANDIPDISAQSFTLTDNADPLLLALLAGATDRDHADLDVTNLSFAISSTAMTTSEISAALATLGNAALTPRDLETGSLTIAPNLFDTLEIGEQAVLTITYDAADGAGGVRANSVTVMVNGETEIMAGATDSDDVLTGSNFNDIGNGGDGDDTISGAGGNDQLTGGEGDDIIAGGSGNDVIDAGSGNDQINAGSGDDSLRGGGGDDVIDGGSGTDTAILEGHWYEYSFAPASAVATAFTRRIGTETTIDLISHVETFVFASGSGSFADLANDAPVLADGSASFAETVDGASLPGAGHVVMTLAATDADTPLGDSVTYSIVGGNDDNVFAIGAGGTIVQTVARDFETHPRTYTLVVRATDRGGLSDTATVTLTLTDVNDPLGPITMTGASSVAEVAPNGTIVATARATDAEGSAVTYALTNNAGGRFAIDSVSGVVSVSNGIRLDFEQAQSHDITIRANSADGTQSTRTVTIAVTDVANEAIVGTAADETVVGGSGNDRFTMGGGNDVITGGGGDDEVVMTVDSDGADQANLGSGNDRVLVSMATAGQVRLTLTAAEIGNGNASDGSSSGGQDGGFAVRLQREDATGALAGPVSRFDDEGISFVASTAGTSFDVREVTNGATIAAAVERVSLGSSGVDTLGAAINERQYLNGGNGNDTLIGGLLADILFGGSGDDVIKGSAGNNTVNGGAGIDTLDLALASGAAVVNMNNGTASANGFGGVDTVAGIENVIGGAFNDTLIGNSGANILTGGSGADYLIGLDGDDTLFGGNSGAANTLQGGRGNDIYVVELSTDTVIEAVGEGIDTIRAIATTFVMRAEVENMIFIGTGDFTGTGNNGDNIITGGAGNDKIDGRGGTDTLTGGAGADEFRFSNSGLDVITDFVSGTDKIALQLGAFSRTVPWALVQGVGAQVATTTQSTFLYSTDTGILSYDADGSGTGAAVTIANLGANTALALGDLIFY